jgi:cytochrome P450
MEFLFTGASSVTTVLVWLVRHISVDEVCRSVPEQSLGRTLTLVISPTPTQNLQARLREEVTAAAKDRWLSLEGAAECPQLEGALRETLRMYPPIHIGRLSLEEFNITDALGKRVTIPAGTDLMSNPWFIQRDPANWTKPVDLFRDLKKDLFT